MAVRSADAARAKLVGAACLVVFLAAACATGAGAVPPPVAGSAPQAEEAVDVKIVSLTGRASAAVGETIGVAAPGGEWQVDFDADVLKLLTPVDKIAAPGPAGWIWRALKSGTTDITFTSVVRCAQPPCPPAAAALTLSLEIRHLSSLFPGGRP